MKEKGKLGMQPIKEPPFLWCSVLWESALMVTLLTIDLTTLKILFIQSQLYCLFMFLPLWHIWNKLVILDMINNYSFFMQACVPYFDILEQWIYKGIISDPYSEVLFI